MKRNEVILCKLCTKRMAYRSKTQNSKLNTPFSTDVVEAIDDLLLSYCIFGRKDNDAVDDRLRCCVATDERLRCCCQLNLSGLDSIFKIEF